MKQGPTVNSWNSSHIDDGAPSAPSMVMQRTHLATVDGVERVVARSIAAPANDEVMTSQIWDPATVPRSASQVPTTSEVLGQQRQPGLLSPEFEAVMIATVRRPLNLGENHMSGNARRERELAELFAQLTPTEAYNLGRRLDLARPEDPLTDTFRLMVADRRARLRAFLADAPRRAARRR